MGMINLPSTRVQWMGARKSRAKKFKLKSISQQLHSQSRADPLGGGGGGNYSCVVRSPRLLVPLIGFRKSDAASNHLTCGTVPPIPWGPWVPFPYSQGSTLHKAPSTRMGGLRPPQGTTHKFRRSRGGAGGHASYRAVPLLPHSVQGLVLSPWPASPRPPALPPSHRPGRIVVGRAAPRGGGGGAPRHRPSLLRDKGCRGAAEEEDTERWRRWARQHLHRGARAGAPWAEIIFFFRCENIFLDALKNNRTSKKKYKNI